MEATGVYWRSPYYALEGMFDELWLCNAQHVKNVPGRKSDLSDAEWLADVAAHGMVRPSFVPPPEIRELRELTRYRKTQVDARAREIQRLEKVLQDAGIKLTSVASAVWSVSSREIIEALISGTADPAVLAQMAKGRMRGKIDRLEEALSGHFGAHHAVVCRQIIDHIDFLDHSIATLTEEVTTRLVPFEAAVTIVTSVASGCDAIFSFLPHGLIGYKLPTEFCVLLFLTGLVRFVTWWYLSGKFVKLEAVISDLAARLPF